VRPFQKSTGVIRTKSIREEDTTIAHKPMLALAKKFAAGGVGVAKISVSCRVAERNARVHSQSRVMREPLYVA